jgi:hypothetical protein
MRDCAISTRCVCSIGWPASARLQAWPAASQAKRRADRTSDSALATAIWWGLLLAEPGLAAGAADGPGLGGVHHLHEGVDRAAGDAERVGAVAHQDEEEAPEERPLVRSPTPPLDLVVGRSRSLDLLDPENLRRSVAVVDDRAHYWPLISTRIGLAPPPLAPGAAHEVTATKRSRSAAKVML